MSPRSREPQRGRQLAGTAPPKRALSCGPDLNTEVTKPINPSTPTPQARDGLIQPTCAAIHHSHPSLPRHWNCLSLLLVAPRQSVATYSFLIFRIHIPPDPQDHGITLRHSKPREQ
jgi:hypothetical protein